MIIDNHAHMGWFSDGYHSPRKVWGDIISAGIGQAAISSTSTCADLYHNIKTEFYQLFSYAGKENIIPILWLSPRMLQKRWPLRKLLKAKIEWRAIKLHYVSHPEWGKFPELITSALNVARVLGNIPILFHTGEWENCHAGVYEPIIAKNPDLTYVLAHGLPIKETVAIMHKYSNVWTDTAFMPIKDIQNLCNAKLSHRIMFGSDIPVTKIYYNEMTAKQYLRMRISEIKSVDPRILSQSIY